MTVDIGERMKYWRREKGMTQDSLAKKADIPYTTIAKIESKIVTNPRMDTLIKIAAGLEINIEDLIKDK